MTSPVYNAFLMDGTTRVGELEYTRLEIASRFLRMGRWEATVPRIPSTLSWKSRIQVTRDGVSVFSGPLRHISRKWTYAETDARTLIGTCDLAYVAAALAYPDPSLSGPPFSTQTHDVRTGPCETVVRDYIRLNVGPNAPANRQQGILLQTNLARGGTVTARARFDNLLDLCREKTLPSGIGFEVVDMTLRFFSTSNLTSFIIFSRELDNLKEYEYEARSPEFNFAMVAGGGEGTARVIVERLDQASINETGRIETFVDQRNTTVVSELEQSGDETLSERSAGDLNIHIIPGVQAVENMRAYDDYYLGDLVTAVIDGEVLESFIQEIGILVTQDDVHEHATLGSFGKGYRATRTNELLQAISRRTRNLEVR